MSEQMEHCLQQYLQTVLVEDFVSLRDFFAGCALVSTSIGHEAGADYRLEVARDVYKLADAMMAARKEHPND